jgi:hypothetical protein
MNKPTSLSPLQLVRKSLKMSARLIVLLVALAGCAPLGRQANGGRMSGKRDTAYSQMENAIVDVRIDAEKNGKSPPPQYSTWNALWLDIIARQKKYSSSDPEPMIRYIVEKRRSVGLPELSPR